MGIDLPNLRTAVERRGAVVRVVVVQARGSTPREVGASMVVWEGGFSGTIGGGALEHAALQEATRLLASDGLWERRALPFALGPGLGQCCGGHVTVVLERLTAFEVAALAELSGGVERPVRSGVAPVTVKAGRSKLDGEVWTEPFAPGPAALWLYGAGHVGRAVVRVTEGLPLSVTWVDVDQERFPRDVPGHATPLLAAAPERVVERAPDDAFHLVMTHSHPIDLAICHVALGRSFRYLGLIGSKTKRERFRRMLGEMGHSPESLGRLTCPVGDPSLGKRPTEIALGVAVELTRALATAE